jgi:hypothetical protein
VYAYTSTGAVFATTFMGFKVMRDRCTFNATPQGDTFVSDVILGSNTVVVTAAAPSDSNIYKSTDDGQTFSVSASPGIADDWWESYVIAPSNPLRVYLSGYRFIKVCNSFSTNAGTTCTINSQCMGSGSGNMAPQCETQKFFLLFRSDDGGATFTPISLANIMTSSSSAIDVLGVDPTNADIVYVKANFESGNMGDGVYKSTNGGGSGSADATAWAKILDKQDPLGMVVLVRSNGSLVAATQTLGAFQAAAGSAGCTSEATCNWTALPTAPHINCLSEQPDTKTVWACTQNYGNGSDIPSDGAGIMKTDDLSTWTPVLKFQDISAPQSCGSGTAMHDQCVAPYMGAPSVWCCLVTQLGITSTAIDCSGAYACTFAGDGVDGDTTHVNNPKGCCNTGDGGVGFVLLGAITGILLYRRRRA